MSVSEKDATTKVSQHGVGGEGSKLTQFRYNGPQYNHGPT